MSTNGANIRSYGTIHTEIDNDLIRTGIVEKEISLFLKGFDPVKAAESLAPIKFNVK